MRSRPNSETVNYNDDSVCEFDVSTSSGDKFYDIFENEEEIISKDSIVWVKNNKCFGGDRVNKTPFGDLPEYSNDLNLIWINKKVR